MLKFLTKWWRTFREQPYVDARFTCQSGGRIQIGVDFNSEFIHRLDLVYADNPAWDRQNPSNVKVALFLYDVIGEVAGEHLPEEQPQGEMDLGFEQIPTLAVRGGQENVTRVDIASAQRYGQPYRSRDRG